MSSLPTDEGNTSSPGLLRRLAAIVYDALLVVPLVMASVALLLGARNVLGADAGSTAPPALVQGIAAACCTGFFGVFWMKSGQTLGMQAWRIKLITSDRGDLTVMRVIIRCGAALLSATCLCLGYLWCVFDPRGRTWHDHLSRTELVLLPKKTKGSASKSAAAQEHDADKHA